MGLSVSGRGDGRIALTVVGALVAGLLVAQAGGGPAAEAQTAAPTLRSVCPAVGRPLDPQRADGDGGPALSAGLAAPVAVAADAAGNVFVVDNVSHTVRRIDAAGTIRTVAGGGTATPGTGGAATAADISPESVAVSPDGSTLYIGEGSTRGNTGNSVRKVDLTAGTISTVLGIPGRTRQAGDPTNVSPLAFTLGRPAALTLNGTHLYVADTDHALLVDLDLTTNSVRTLTNNDNTASSPLWGPIGTTGTASASYVGDVQSLTHDDAGQLYVATPLGVLRINPVTDEALHYVGSSQNGLTGNSPTPVDASTALFGPHQNLAWANGTLYLSDSTYNIVRAVTQASPTLTTVTTVVGDRTAGFADGTPGRVASPAGLAIGPGTAPGSHTLLIADHRNHAVRRFNAANSQVTTVGGSGPRANSATESAIATETTHTDISGVAYDPADGSSYVSSRYESRIFRVSADGRTHLFAGSGAMRPLFPNSAVDGDPAATHEFAGVGQLRVVVIGGVRWLYAIDGFGGNANGTRLVRINLNDPNHPVTTVAGTEDPAVSPADGVAATTANFNHGLSAYTVDPTNGDALVADNPNGRVWSVTAATGRLARWAGNANGPAGVVPDGTDRLNAEFNYPWALERAADGTVYVGAATATTTQVYAIATNGKLTRLAGNENGLPPTDPADTTATHVPVPAGLGLLVEPQGSILIAEGALIRRIAMPTTTTSAAISVVAQASSNGDWNAMAGEQPTDSAGVLISRQLANAGSGSVLLAGSVYNGGADNLDSARRDAGTPLVRRLTAGGCADLTISGAGGGPFNGAINLNDAAPVNVSKLDFDGLAPAALTAGALQAWLKSIPLRNVAAAASPLRNVPLRNVPLRNVGIPPILLSTLQLTEGRRWEDLLRGTSLEGVPVQSITIQQVLDVASGPTAPAALATLSLADVDVSGSPLRNVSLSSIALGATTLTQLPGQNPPEADPYTTTWCPWITSVGLPCSSFSGSSTLLDLEVAAASLSTAPLRNVPLRNVPLRNVDLKDAPLRNVPLRNVDLSFTPLRNVPLRNVVLSTPLRNVPLRNVPLRNVDPAASPLRNVPLRNVANPAAIVDCSRIDCSATSARTLADAAAMVPTAINDVTLGALFAALLSPVGDQFVLGDLGEYGAVTIGDIQGALPDSITLADVILALVPRTALQWEALNLDELNLAAFGGLPASPLSVDVTVGAGRAADRTAVTLALPAGAALVRTPVSISALNGTPFNEPNARVTTDGRTVKIALPAAAPGSQRYRVSLQLSGWKSTDPISVTATDTILGDLGLSTGSVALTAVSTGVPRVPTMADGDLLLGGVANPGQVQTVDIPVPAVAGAVTEVTLSHVSADLDLVAYQPTIRPPLTTRTLRTNGLKTPPMESTDPELAGAQAQIDPQALRDIPLDADPSTVLSYSASRGTADERIEVVSRPGDQGVYRVQVSGYNGATTTTPYLLTVRQRVPLGAGACPARVPATTGAAAATPGTITAQTRALFLVNGQRLAETYGQQAANATLAKLDQVAARPEVAGSVVRVDGDPAVRAAYANWDAAPCDGDRANQVVGAIDTLVDRLQATLPGTGPKAVTSLTLVGSDEMLPLARVADGTKTSNESQYAADVQRVDAQGAPAGPSPLSSSLAARSTLTDDAYADWDPYAWRDGVLFVPDIGVGRLVEKPGQINTALDAYLANVTATSRPAQLRGRLDESTALTTGYDFLSDGAHDVDVKLGTRAPTHHTLINETWTRADLLAGLYGSTTPDVASLNAHFDHSAALPAAGNTTGDTSDLLTTADVVTNPSRLFGRIIFSMGCHSGLSVPDGYLTGSATTADATPNPAPAPGDTAATTAARARRLDWAEAFANDGAIYVGNTGFGFGDTNTVAFSEALMSNFAGQLNGVLPVGQSLTEAKNRYFADTQLAFSDYDAKVTQQTVLYGLPFWGVGTPATAPTPPAPVTTTLDPQTAGLPVARSFLTPNFATTTALGGQVTTSDGNRPLVVDGQPITARSTIDVTPAAGLETHGYLITGLQSTDTPGVDVAFGRAVIDNSANEPAREANGAVFPATLQNTAVVSTANGPRQSAELATTQFIDDPNNATPGIGTVRRFTRIDGQALYAPTTERDGISPTILQTNATANGSGIGFSVRAVDQRPGATAGSVVPGTVVRVLVLYRDGGTWRSVDLSRSAVNNGVDTWSANAATTNTAVDYFVQVVDAAGNVSVSSNKATLFRSAATTDNLAPTVTLGGDRVVTAGTLTLSGSFTDPDGPAPATASIDLGTGAGFTPLPVTATPGGGTFSTTTTVTAGTRTVVVKVCDAANHCGTATVTLTVVANPAPGVPVPYVSCAGLVKGRQVFGFGYRNTGGSMRIPLGLRNLVVPAPTTGPPVVFDTGTHPAVVTVRSWFPIAVWAIDGRLALAWAGMSGVPACT
jgi:uncharacterized protein YjbI with pentapeptide repeats